MPNVTKSPWIMHYDGTSCNGCDIEVLACLTPLYDVERFGVINTGNPKHADIFLVTGSVNAQNLPVVRQIYNQMLEPKCVVACGICACSGGVFRDAYNVIGGVKRAGRAPDLRADERAKGGVRHWGVRLQRRRVQGLLQCAGRGGQSDPRRYLCARVRRAAGEYY